MKKIISTPIQLIPVTCPDCQAPLKSRGQEIFFYCDVCETGFELRENKLYPVHIEFRHHRGKLNGVERTVPFWVFDTKLKIHLREASSVTSSLLSELGNYLCGNMGFSGKKKDLTFYVPAYNDAPDQLAAVGRRLTINQPHFEEYHPCDFEPLAYDSRDAAEMADYIFISSQIEKPDILSRLKYTLDLKSPILMVIRFG